MNRTKAPRKPTALVIDRDADVHRFIHVFLGKQFDVHHAYFPKLAISLLQRRRFTLVVASTDMEYGDESPNLRDAIQAVTHSAGASVIHLLTGRSDSDHSGSSSTEYVLDKPLSARAFGESLSRALPEDVAIPSFAQA